MVVALMLLLPWSPFVSGQNGEPTLPTIYIAGSGNTSLDQHVTRLLREQIGDTAELVFIHDDQSLRTSGSPVITIGPAAFTRIRQINRNTPILALLVERKFIQGYVNRTPGQVSAVFYDVPLLRQALAGKAILPQSNRIALLASTESVEIYEDLIDQLAEYSLEARVFVTDSDDQLIPTLIRALNYGDFLLAGSDDAIYNPRNIKHILLTAYRRNRIVIGPSQAYVKAGVLASGYAPFPAMAAKAGELLQAYFETGILPEPAYPNEFRVELNEQVARSLNIPLPSREWISQYLDDLMLSSQEDLE
jgi:ABC-type uncharacterized transport system substrate-binding protein